MRNHSGIRNNLLIFLLGVSMICVIYSIYLLSMSLIGILIVVCLSYEQEGGIRIGINPALWKARTYRNVWPFGGFLLYFLWIVLSLAWSDGNVGPWFQDIVQKLSILGIALIFLLIPRLSPKDVMVLHSVFYFGLAIACLLVLWVYIPSYAEITLLIGRGRAIPVPMDHVRFSMLLSYGCLSAISFLWIGKRWGLSSKKRYVFIATVGLLFFVMTHILAVRSGLILLYAGLFILILYIVLSQKAWKIGIIAFIATLALPILAYRTIPSVQNKVKYMRYDMERYITADDLYYSDSDRLRSMATGINLWKQAPILGYGAGGYKLALDEYYESIDYSGKRLAPHNQWIRTGMAYGLVGVLILAGAFLFALYYRSGYKHLLLLLIISLFLISFMVESNMERYYALVFFMLCMGMGSRIR